MIEGAWIKVLYVVSACRSKGRGWDIAVIQGPSSKQWLVAGHRPFGKTAFSGKERPKLNGRRLKGFFCRT